MRCEDDINVVWVVLGDPETHNGTLGAITSADEEGQALRGTGAAAVPGVTRETTTTNRVVEWLDQVCVRQTMTAYHLGQTSCENWENEIYWVWGVLGGFWRLLTAIVTLGLDRATVHVHVYVS